MVSASYFPATRFPSTAYVANPIEPVIVIASPNSDGERGEIPFSEANTATPANAIAMPRQDHLRVRTTVPTKS